ncbi:hypothetical protein GGX14DRAFT_577109 [Mycena pura]|uniref:Uncharacterized protein n=1 Tax=Mycena pura TaxID=153505 RepID=A0AAD6US96_9AGAR|nr:hypothetical protein GGX14DRAFT_577109 [Mycena pura]
MVSLYEAITTHVPVLNCAHTATPRGPLAGAYKTQDPVVDTQRAPSTAVTTGLTDGRSSKPPLCANITALPSPCLGAGAAAPVPLLRVTSLACVRGGGRAITVTTFHGAYPVHPHEPPGAARDCASWEGCCARHWRGCCSSRATASSGEVLTVGGRVAPRCGCISHAGLLPLQRGVLQYASAHALPHHYLVPQLPDVLCRRMQRRRREAAVRVTGAAAVLRAHGPAAASSVLLRGGTRMRRRCVQSVVVLRDVVGASRALACHLYYTDALFRSMPLRSLPHHYLVPVPPGVLAGACAGPGGAIMVPTFHGVYPVRAVGCTARLGRLLCVVCAAETAAVLRVDRHAALQRWRHSGAREVRAVGIRVALCSTKIVFFRCAHLFPHMNANT